MRNAQLLDDPESVVAVRVQHKREMRCSRKEPFGCLHSDAQITFVNVNAAVTLPDLINADTGWHSFNFTVYEQVPIFVLNHHAR